MVGVTEMVGIDDYGPAETFTTDDAVTVANWAAAKGLAGCRSGRSSATTAAARAPGRSDPCSGVAQSTWYFSHIFEPFTRR